MRIDLAVAVPALLVATLATGVVVVRTVRAPAPRTPQPATADQRLALAMLVASDEPTWARKSAESFPEDDWSARDDFHEREMKRIRQLAAQHRVPIEDVLRAIDDDLHGASAHADSGDPRAARAVPCKPRPFYD